MRQRSKTLFIIIWMYVVTMADITAQDIDYARSVIDTLASPAMHGRGYVSDGSGKAAGYLAEEFRRIGLLKAGRSYFQPFTLPVNTFPARMKLLLNEHELQPGEDFLVYPNAPAAEVQGEVHYFQSAELLDIRKLIYQAQSQKKNIFVADISGFGDQQLQSQALQNVQQAALQLPHKVLLVLTDKKLSWSVAGHVARSPLLLIRKKSVNTLIKSASIVIDQQFHDDYSGKNVIGYLPGVSQDSVIMLTAHYDHLGRMGTDTYFPGANDNASGVALLLDLAKKFAADSVTPLYDMVFIAFGGEEAGLVGSRYYVENPLLPLRKTKFLYNLDLAGTGDDGITVVNATQYPAYFELLQNINHEYTLLTHIKSRTEACNSDHCFFYKAGVKCFYSYTLGGITAYHDIYDRAETLPLTEYNDYFTLIYQFLTKINQ